MCNASGKGMSVIDYKLNGILSINILPSLKSINTFVIWGAKLFLRFVLKMQRRNQLRMILSHWMYFLFFFELLFWSNIQIVFLHLQWFITLFRPYYFISLKGLDSIDLNPIIKEVLIKGICWVSHQI